MSLFTVFVVLCVVGVVLYAIKRYAPMDESMKKLITVVAIVGCVIWLLDGFGFLDFLKTVHIGKVHR